MGKKILKKLTLKEKKKLKMKEVDMPEIKSKIKSEFLITFGMTPNDYSNNSYEQRYGEYITEEFNVKCVFLIVSFINSSSTLPSHLRNELDIHKELLSIIKELMMNEFEISLFTMYIDDIGWQKKEFKESLHLLCIAILTKCHTNRSIELFINHFKQQNKSFPDFFMGWRDDIKEASFSTIEINERFRQLNRPYNTYCQKNYIDYNSAVDKIIQLSKPYGEDNKGNMIIKEDNSLDVLKVPSFYPFRRQSSQRFNHNENNNDPLTLIDRSRMHSFLSVSSKNNEMDDNNLLELMNSKSYIDQSQPAIKQTSEYFNFFPNSLRKEQSSNIFDNSDIFGINKNSFRMKSSNLSNVADSRLFQPQPKQIQASNYSLANDFYKSLIKEKKDS